MFQDPSFLNTIGFDLTISGVSFMFDKSLEVYGRIIKIIEKVEILILMVLLSTMIILVSMEIFVRFLLNSSLPWVQQTVILLSVWMVFVGTAVAYKQKKYITVHYFKAKFPSLLRMTLTWTVNSILIYFFGFLVYYSYLFQFYQYGSQDPVLGISRLFFSLPVLMSFISLLLTVIYSTILDYKKA